MKKHVITFARVFPTDHPRAGSQTAFRELIFARQKLHTVRGSEKWIERLDEVARGEAILSLRQWSGKPYASKQFEFQRVTAECRPGTQRIEMDPDSSVAIIDGVPWPKNMLASNDGLSLKDFNDWFPKPLKNGVIIHLTDFRYHVKSEAQIRRSKSLSS